MSTVTQWILELIDHVTAPMAAVEAASGSAAEAVESVQAASRSAAEAAGSFASAATGAAQAENSLADAADDFSESGSGAVNVLDMLKKAVLPFLAVGALMGGVTKSLRAFDVQAKADAQVLTTLESTSYATGRSFEQLKKQASDLQAITLFGDETTQGAQAIMLGFKNIREEIYDRSIPAVLDLSTHLNMDLKSSAIMVGKSLNDPIEGITALKQASVLFTEDQQNLIKSLVESGRIMEAQTIILDELESKVGGSAKAAKAGLGVFQSIGNSWGDLTERMGALIFGMFKLVEPVVNALIVSFNSLFDWIDRNIEVIKAIATGVASTILIFGAFRLAVFALSGGFRTLAMSAVASCRVISAAIMSIPIIGWIAAIIAGLIALATYFYNTSESFRGFLWGLWEAVKAVFGGIGSFIKDVLEGVWHLIKGVFNPANWFDDNYKFADGIKKITDAASDYGEKIGAAFAEGRNKGIENFRQEKAGEESGTGSMDINSLAAGAGIVPGSVKTGKKTGKEQDGIRLGGSGSGNGKSITMNITQNNHFSGSQNPQEIAEVIFRMLNDRFRDSALAL